jgi:hypothetical protein
MASNELLLGNSWMTSVELGWGTLGWLQKIKGNNTMKRIQSRKE